MKRGSIVLTKFPFTDLSFAKRRPAVIISNTSYEKQDVVVAFISSVIPDLINKSEFVLDVWHKDFPGTGLKKKSIFKMDKLATLNKSIFSGELGEVSPDILADLEVKLKFALDLRDRK